MLPCWTWSTIANRSFDPRNLVSSGQAIEQASVERSRIRQAKRPHTGIHRAHIYKIHTLTFSNRQYWEKEIDRDRQSSNSFGYTYTDAAFLHLPSSLSSFFPFHFLFFSLFSFQVAFAVFLFPGVSFHPIVSMEDTSGWSAPLSARTKPFLIDDSMIGSWRTLSREIDLRFNTLHSFCVEMQDFYKIYSSE